MSVWHFQDRMKVANDILSFFNEKGKKRPLSWAYCLYFFLFILPFIIIIFSVILFCRTPVFMLSHFLFNICSLHWIKGISVRWIWQLSLKTQLWGDRYACTEQLECVLGLLTISTANHILSMLLPPPAPGPDQYLCNTKVLLSPSVSVWMTLFFFKRTGGRGASKGLTSNL